MKTIRPIITFMILAFGLRMNAQVTAPEPVSGKTLAKEYITQNLVYPEADLEQGNSGKVVVAFHLNAQGEASQHAVKSSFSEAASPVALHLVKTLLWSPALISGLPSDYDFEYEVEFNAKSYKRYWKRHQRLEAPLALEADTSYRIYEYKQLEEIAKPYFADGGNMGKYIVTNMKFPPEAKEREIQGTVRLSFVVETDGSVSNIVVVNSVGGGCDNEAVRLLQGTIWIPAEKNGKYVRSYSMQDITFSIGSRNFQDGNSY
ncbi:MAG: TonB family protein [Bacteroidales bacterium]|nr:TonB family protein [Bacteroidales bacterium]